MNGGSQSFNAVNELRRLAHWTPHLGASRGISGDLASSRPQARALDENALHHQPVFGGKGVAGV